MIVEIEKYELMNSAFTHKCILYFSKVEFPKYTDFWQNLFFQNYENQGQSTEEKEIKEEGKKLWQE